MNMKRLFIILTVCALTTTLGAQYTQLYSGRDAAYAEGVDLYHQGQYAASYRALSQYLRLPQTNYSEEAEFFLLASAFELRQKEAEKLLSAYLKEHTYTTYASEVNFMLGTLQAEKGKSKQALKYYQKVKISELFRGHDATYLFYSGYCNLQLGKVNEALPYFSDLRGKESQFALQSRYYYAFCHYTLQNYPQALPDFLAIEHTAQYKDIVPYYVIQIYYAQGKYNEVYERAAYLLKHNPENAYNGELHRILGEIYYQEGKYTEAIPHLLAYEESFRAQGHELVRNDVYLLGMSYYQTGDWANAVKYLQRMDKTDDALTENAYFHIGNAYVHLHQPAQAKMAYSTAIRYSLTPAIREEAMYNYALTTYQSQTAFGESITAFTDFLKAYPQSKHTAEVYELLSDVFLHAKNYQAALNALDSIKHPSYKLLETKQYLRYQLATDAFLQDKIDEATRLFTAVIDHESKVSNYKTESYFWRAECFYRQGLWEKAQADLERFMKQSNVRKSKNRVIANYSKGYTLFAQKDYPQARRAFEAYIADADESLSTYADALNRIGDCQFIARQFTQAENTYSKVVQLQSVGVDYALFQQGYVLGLIKQYNEKIRILSDLVQRYPRSDYADDAIYEMARAEIQRENNTEAIKIYDRLLADYPNSVLARKAALEKAMLYYNLKNYEAAILNYKSVVKNYPATEEAYAALDGLQAAYVETDRVSEYLDYTKTLGRLNMQVSSQEDSLTYVAAERQYILQNYTSAVAGLGKYISQYCDGGRYCIPAHYYYANSHYLLGNKPEAREAFKDLEALGNTPHREEACTRVAEISFDLQDYTTALHYFTLLETIASSQDKKTVAHLGQLRSSARLADHPSTIRFADAIIADDHASTQLKTEARYQKGKAHIAQAQYAEAIECLTPVATETRTAQGAEAKYLLCQAYFQQNDLERAEAEIMSFASMNTQHQYWLAKSFIVLADIYTARNDDFQAKQYLLSLQTNYKAQDDVQTSIVERLAQIEAREQQAKQNTVKTDNHEEDF